MSFIAVHLAEERKLDLHAQLLGWRKAGIAIGDEAITTSKSAWRVSRLFSRIAFFLLTSFVLGAFYGLCQLFRLPGELLTGIAAVVSAELLIRKQFLRTGIEEALYIFGLSALIGSIPSQGSKEGLLLFAAAFAWAGFRLAHAVFLTISTAIVIAYLVIRSDEMTAGAIACLIIFVLVHVASRSRQQRPFIAASLSVLSATALPAAMALQLAAFDPPSRAPAIFLVLGLIVGIGATVEGLRSRNHAVLLAGGLTILLATVFIGQRLEKVPLEWQLIAGGTVTLVSALFANRALRGRGAGITSDALTAAKEVEMLEMAGTAALSAATTDRQAPSGAAPEVTPADPSSPSFGGAGSTGEY